jgi:hypothetical protein
VAIFYAGDITTKQASSLFDIALGEFLFLAHFAEAVADNHGALLHPLLYRASASIYRRLSVMPTVACSFCGAKHDW